MIHWRNAEIVRALCPDRGDFGGREQPVPDRDMRERPFEAGRLHAADRYWTRAMLGMYLVLEILVGGDPLRLDALLPQDAAGCLVGRRNPGLGLADYEHPLSKFNWGFVVRGHAIFHVRAIAFARGRAEIERVKG